ncbi:MAG TPA: dihydrolipoamide acetyltransferase family protein [Polyangiaceae bacterium]|jgi:pyruvate dehydrogenase E2 component (dihydrolipoamide acetyltransferase)
MARWEFKLPDIGEGVTEGEVVNWLVKPGDVVKEDQPMVEVMTDKATVTIGAPRAGTILETAGKVGEVVKVHSTLVVFELGGGGAAASAAVGNGGNGHGPASGGTNGTTKKDDGPAATAVGDIKEELPGLGARAPSAGAMEQVSSFKNDKPLATPATRRLAREMNVDLTRVPPTGPQGRTTKADVQLFAKAPAPPATATQAAAASAPSAAQTSAPAVHAPPAREAVKIHAPTAAQASLEERVPFAGLRRKIAAKMQQSKQTAAHFTFVEECDVSALKGLRARMKPQAEAQGVKLSFLPFLVKACVAGLKKHPILNSALDESTNELVYRKYYNIGIAASTEGGLIVPVVKDCDRKSILEIAREIERVATDAKNGKSKLEDLSGSTFTITSLGSQGGLFATPIINFPEVAILGVHQIKQKPVVKDGQIAIGEVMLLSLSFDHRIVDGHVGAAFAYEVIGYLENPDRLFLEMA